MKNIERERNIAEQNVAVLHKKLQEKENDFEVKVSFI